MLFTLSTLALLLPAVLGQTVNVPLEIESIEALFSNAQLVPELLPTFAPTAALHFSFDNTTDNTAGQALTVQQVSTLPTLHLYTTPLTDLSAFYTLMMVDADVVGTDETVGQTRHWLVNDVSLSATQPLTFDLSNATAITEFAGPFPASGSGPHRYCLFLYAQPASFTPPGDLDTPDTPLANNWDFAGYVNSTGLGPLVAGTFYTVEQGTDSTSIPAIPTVVSSTLALARSSASAAASKTGSSASPSGSAGAGSGSGSGKSGAVGRVVSSLAVVAVAGLTAVVLL